MISGDSNVTEEKSSTSSRVVELKGERFVTHVDLSSEPLVS
jgi:hypothetical protein